MPENFEKYLEAAETVLNRPELMKPAVEFEYLEKQCQGNEILEGLLKDMLDYMYRYVEDVCRFNEVAQKDLTDPKVNEEFQDIDRERGVVHDAMIDSVNILSRNLAQAGRDNGWMEAVGASRAAYGKFAILTVLSRLLKPELAIGLEEVIK